VLVKTIAGSNSTSGRQAGVVADQLAAAAGKDRRAFDTACPYYWLVLAESYLRRRISAFATQVEAPA
jgi:hypothetical protein